MKNSNFTTKTVLVAIFCQLFITDFSYLRSQAQGAPVVHPLLGEVNAQIAAKLLAHSKRQSEIEAARPMAPPKVSGFTTLDKAIGLAMITPVVLLVAGGLGLVVGTSSAGALETLIINYVKTDFFTPDNPIGLEFAGAVAGSAIAAVGVVALYIKLIRSWMSTAQQE